MYLPRKLLVAAGAVAFLPGLAEAHVSAMHGGLGAGILHPMLGLDHLLAMLVVGAAVAALPGARRFVPPLLFLSAMAAGTVYGMSGLPLPHVEPLIAFSLVALGGLLAFGFPMMLGCIAIGLGGLVHGYAHGAELPADASGPAFMIGMMMATAVIHAVGLGLAIVLRRLPDGLGRLALPGFGGAVGLAGAALMLMGG